MRTDRIHKENMLRRFRLSVLFIFALCLGTPFMAREVQAAAEGFRTVGGKTYYIKSDGQKQKGWLTLDGKRYYFNTKTGVQLKGWQYNTSRQKIRYFTKGQGYMVTGYLTDGSGNTRYFKPENGLLVRGWMKDSSGYKYYFTSGSGVMAKGWLTDSKGRKRYFSRETGRMLTGWQKSEAGQYRYFQTGTGVMHTGLQKIGGDRFYFDKNTGVRFQDGFRTIGKKTYYFSQENGKAHTGWLTLEEKKYYFSSAGVMYADRTASISGETYVFDEEGVARESSPEFTVEGNNVRVYDSTNERYYYMRKEYVEHPGVLSGETTDRDLLAALCESEAGDQGLIGMEAVALCVLNRTLDPDRDFPSSPRMVIYQGGSFAQYSVVSNGALLKRLNGEFENRALAYKAADAALEIFDKYVREGTPRTLKGFDRKDFNFMYFMMESAYYSMNLDFDRVDHFLYKDHMFFVSWVS